MIDLHHVLLLGLTLLLASAVPFVPTGELVSGAAALSAPSLPLAVAIFAVAWVASVAGDTLLLTEVRLLDRPLQAWRDRHAPAPKVQQAQAWLMRSTFTAVVTARLVPGMRAPVIVALGLAGIRRRTFVLADLVGCGLWAALYTTVGSVGGRVTSHPLVAVAFAVLLAVTASSLGGLLVRRRHAARAEEQPADREDLAGCAAGSRADGAPTSSGKGFPVEE